MEDPPFSMRKSTISMAIFNSYVSLPEGISSINHPLTNHPLTKRPFIHSPLIIHSPSIESIFTIHSFHPFHASNHHLFIINHPVSTMVFHL